MIKFEDFEPKIVKSGGMLSSNVYESMEDVMVKVNALITRRGVELVNIETVVLPNIHADGEEGTRDPDLPVFGGMGEWNQFIRVWYREG